MTTPSSLIPTGIVTVLFTDVEGSTRLWAANVETTAESFVKHDAIIRAAIEDNDGYVFGWAGDSFRGVFDAPADEADGSIQAQQ
jgi:class 3 adenylate cyclase